MPKTTKNKLAELQRNPVAFRNTLLIDAGGVARPLGQVCEQWQQRDFEALDPAWQRVAGHRTAGPMRAWLERPEDIANRAMSWRWSLGSYSLVSGPLPGSW